MKGPILDKFLLVKRAYSKYIFQQNVDAVCFCPLDDDRCNIMTKPVSPSEMASCQEPLFVNSFTALHHLKDKYIYILLFKEVCGAQTDK